MHVYLVTFVVVAVICVFYASLNEPHLELGAEGEKRYSNVCDCCFDGIYR